MARFTLADLPDEHRQEAAKQLGIALPAASATASTEDQEQNRLIRLFLSYWDRNALPRLTTEHRFHPARKWRFDLAIPDLKIAIEIDGGTWIQGRHNRAGGYANDAEKINAAQGLGWYVFRFSDLMLTGDRMDELLEPVWEAIRMREKEIQ